MTANSAIASTRPTTTPGKRPFAAIVRRIARTIAYSSAGRDRRTSTTHSTMKPSPMKTSTPPTIIRGMTSMTDAPNTTAVSGTSAATSPAARAPTFIRCASDVSARAW